MAQLAWIGLGNMGRGMAKNLVEKGNLSKPLILFNRTRKRADDLADKLEPEKTRVVGETSQAVDAADIIFTCVGDDKAINEIIDTICKQNIKLKLIVDCSTVHPNTTNALSKNVIASGGNFVASPVFGAPAMAEAGQLVFVLAGTSTHTELIKPYTTGVMAKSIIDFSDQEPGKASLLKVIGNSMVLQMIESLSEGHTVAEKSGLGVDNLHQFIEALFPGPYTAYSNRMRQGDYHKREEPLFQVDLARKDAHHVLDVAQRSGAAMPAVEVADQHLKQVKEHSGAKGDIAGIYGALRKECGLNFEN
ncbi:MAG: hypothetical protein M1831_005030 [Alyxoria varia]|nr:MAG: hypothetical protein M1831_005030 [Alyxoria varia]